MDVLSDVLKAVEFDRATFHHAECSTLSQRPQSQPSSLCNRAQDYSHERPFRCAWSKRHGCVLAVELRAFQSAVSSIRHVLL
jgi:hypothetical protein